MKLNGEGEAGNFGVPLIVKQKLPGPGFPDRRIWQENNER